MSRISSTLDSVNTSTSNTSVSITATGHFKYASGTWGWTVDGYLSIDGSKKNFDNAKGTTSGGTFGSISYTKSITRTKSSKSVTVKLYGYCDESTSDTATATKSVTIPALPSYTVTCDGTSYTKWYGETLSLPQPKKAGYTFKGWKDSSGNTYTTTYTGNSAKTLTSVWVANTVAPKVNNCSAIRRDGELTTVGVSLSYTNGKNSDGTPVEVSKLKLEISEKGLGSWNTVFNVDNPPQLFTGTLQNISESKAYDLRWTLYDANYPNGVTAYDVITKTSYIWRATGEGLDFGVPISVDGVTVPVISGEVLTATHDTASTLTKETWTKKANSTITLEPGTWVIKGYGNFRSKSTGTGSTDSSAGYRDIRLGYQQDGDASSLTASIAKAYVGAGQTAYLQTIAIRNFSKQTKIWVDVYSSNAVGFDSCRTEAVRIK